MHLTRSFIYIFSILIISVILSGCGEQSFSQKKNGFTIFSGPADFSAQATDGVIFLTWTQKEETKYTIYWGTNNNFSISSAEGFVENAKSPYEHSELDTGATYHYTIVAIKDGQQSLASQVQSIIPVATPVLSKPENIQVHPDDQFNHLVWNAVPGAKNYLVYWTNVENENPENSNNPVLHLEKTQFNHNRLKNDVTIYYKVRSQSGEIESPLSEKVWGTPSASTLARPNNLRLKSKGQTSIIIEWDKVASAKSYKVYWSTVRRDFQLKNSSFSVVDIAQKNFMLGDLTPNRTYYLVVVALDEEGLEGLVSYVLEVPFRIKSLDESNPDPIDPPTDPVDQPTEPLPGETNVLPPSNIVVVVSAESAIFSWETDNIQASYKLFIAKQPGVNKENYSDLEGGSSYQIANGQSYALENLEVATSYYFSMISILDLKESDESIEQQFMVLIPESEYQSASYEKGAKLYDKWWRGANAKPKEESPLWKLAATNSEGETINRAVTADTWRCAECHGWDYKGQAGLYGSGNLHYTGFIGIEDAGENKTKEYIYNFIRSGKSSEGIAHKFEELSKRDLVSLTKFIKNYSANASDFWSGSSEAGIALYNEENISERTCNESSCHPDTRDNFGKKYLLAYALNDPAQFSHYVRFGKGRMPAGLSLINANDIVAYLWDESINTFSSNFSEVDYKTSTMDVDEQWAWGGRLYDRWVLAKSSDTIFAISSNHPLWPSIGTAVNGLDTWRCKECHGWDYLGKNGVYSKGFHFTGIDGILSNAPKTTTAKEIYDFIRSSGLHAFKRYLSDEEIYALTRFISITREEALNNNTPADWIDFKFQAPINFDLADGRTKYRSTTPNGGCRSCHRKTGSSWSFNDLDPDRNEIQNIVTIARENPWEFLHKVRFGHPGSTMPGIIENNRNSELKLYRSAVDILAFAQTNLAPDVKRGGRLYDNWWKENNFSEPTQSNALMPMDAGVSALDSWRCSTCHGWNYQGQFGIKGLTTIGTDIIDFIRAGMVENPNDHAFQNKLKISDLADLVEFIGNPDLSGVRSDIGTLLTVADITSGQNVYSNDTPGNCIFCHGANGTSIPNVDLRFVAENEPSLLVHKSRFGAAGSIMRPTLTRFVGLDVLDAVNTAVFAATMVSGAGDVSNRASLDRGGRLFDNWIFEMQTNDKSVQAPLVANPLWQDRRPDIPDVQSISASWRCITCHSWDYKGIDLMEANPDADNLFARLAKLKERFVDEISFADYLYNWIKSGNSTRHNYGSVDSGLPSILGDNEIADLVLFLQQGVIDTEAYIYSLDGQTIGADPQQGKLLYQGEILTEVNCESCHGASGESIPKGGSNAVDIFALSSNDPWKFLHKIRFSTSGTEMPSLIGIPGSQIDHAINILAYAQKVFASRR